jgi:hypothetical protein
MGTKARVLNEMNYCMLACTSMSITLHHVAGAYKLYKNSTFKLCNSAKKKKIKVNGTTPGLQVIE